MGQKAPGRREDRGGRAVRAAGTRRPGGREARPPEFEDRPCWPAPRWEARPQVATTRRRSVRKWGPVAARCWVGRLMRYLLLRAKRRFRSGQGTRCPRGRTDRDRTPQHNRNSGSSRPTRSRSGHRRACAQLHQLREQHRIGICRAQLCAQRCDPVRPGHGVLSRESSTWSACADHERGAGEPLVLYLSWEAIAVTSTSRNPFQSVVLTMKLAACVT